MQNLRLVRVDERLIHGQVVTAWSRFSGCNTIVVADDKAANDSLSKSLFKMAIPKQISLAVLSLEGAYEFIKKKSDKKIMLIVGSLENLYKILNYGLEVSKVNVGNISQHAKKKKYSKSIWLDENDLEYIEKIQSKGVDLYIQVVPNEKKQNVKTFLKK